MNREIKIPAQTFAFAYLLMALAVIVWEGVRGGQLSGIFSIIVTLPSIFLALPLLWLYGLLTPIGAEYSKIPFFVCATLAALLNFAGIRFLIRKATRTTGGK